MFRTINFKNWMQRKSESEHKCILSFSTLSSVIKEIDKLKDSSPLGSFAPVFRRPVEAFGINPDAPFLHRLVVVLHDVLGDAQNILALVVINQI